MKYRSVQECLDAVREASATMDPADCLYRGEPGWYGTTCSSHHRLFSRTGPFTKEEAHATKERLLEIARILDLVVLERPLFADPLVAARHASPLRLEDVNEVIYCCMQHYHLATPFIDLTTDLAIATSFAAGDGTEDDLDFGKHPGPCRGAIYLVSRGGLNALGCITFDSSASVRLRPARQKAVSLFLEEDKDFQSFTERRFDGRPVVNKFEFEVVESSVIPYRIPDLYSAVNDRVAREVARLAHDCAYRDGAPTDRSAWVVNDYFSRIAYRLADAGALTSGNPS